MTRLDQKRYLNLELKKCPRIKTPGVIPDPVSKVQSNQPSFESKEHRNPYQAKINYFQTAMRNSNIDFGLSNNKHSSKMKYSKRESKCSSSTRNQGKRVGRAMTPSSQKSTPSSQKGMTISHSVKDQMNVNGEIYRNNSKEELQSEIMKLNKKIMKLEKGNKCLKEENKRYQSIYTQPNAGVSLKPPHSHYKVS